MMVNITMVGLGDGVAKAASLGLHITSQLGAPEGA
jgi:hypothetical protein